MSAPLTLQSKIERVVHADRDIRNYRKRAQHPQPYQPHFAVFADSQAPVVPDKSDHRPNADAGKRHNPEENLAKHMAHKDENPWCASYDTGPEVIGPGLSCVTGLQ